MILKIRKIFEQSVSDIFMTIKTASRISSVVECLVVKWEVKGSIPGARLIPGC